MSKKKVGSAFLLDGKYMKILSGMCPECSRWTYIIISRINQEFSI
jgi:hypothetical protein